MSPIFPVALRRPVAVLLFLSLAAAVPAADDALARDARAAMEKSTAFMRAIAAEGGYLWRYSPDLKERAGEEVATVSQIWVQPPGTPSMGMAFLRAYEVTGDARYLDAAQAAADALVTGQLASGGWDYLVDFDPVQAKKWYRRSDMGKIPAAEAAMRRNVTTFDDDNTQSAIRLLVAVADAAKGADGPRDRRIRGARDYALTQLTAAQRPIGGWPQRWTGVPADPREYPVTRASLPADYPREYPRQNYNGHYTLNDDTQRDCVMTLLDAARTLGRPELRAAALKGGDFLIMAQLPEPQPTWAQQYNGRMEPAWARAFEPPAACSNESGGAMRLLVDLYLETGDRRYLEPLPRAIAWFKRSEVAPGIWARLYELHTNKPVFGDRDGKIHYTVEELTPERQTGYSWRSSYGLPAVFAYYDEVVAKGREAMLAQREAAAARAKSARGKAARAAALAPKVRAVITELDAQGRWIGSGGRRANGPQITTTAFIANLRLLADYLEAVK